MDKFTVSHRNFWKVSGAMGGCMLTGFNWTRCKPDHEIEIASKTVPSEWYTFDAYIIMGETGLVTFQSANPEIVHNIKTAMPMIVADELDLEHLTRRFDPKLYLTEKK